MALLRETLDSELLREKELGQSILAWEHRLREMQDSRDHRELGMLPPSGPPELPANPAVASLEAYLRSRAQTPQP